MLFLLWQSKFTNSNILFSNKYNRGKNGVLISEEDWNAIQETLYLNSIPRMTESIIESGKEPLEECSVYGPDEEW